MIKNRIDISLAVSDHLCLSCGACYAVCKNNAITFYETVGGYLFPKIDKNLCINCGLCYNVCPGINFSNELLSKVPQDTFKGEALKSYLGRAQCEDIFKNAQNGGVVSALSCYAIESGQADAVVTVAMQRGNPSRASAFLARSREQILKAQRSKYSMVPVLSVLKGLKESDRRIVLIGLPCHIHGLCNLYELLPGLKEKIILTIGLFCERTVTNAAMDYLIGKSGL
jgi:coenzyme F420 hydrogenase subunit beta